MTKIYINERERYFGTAPTPVHQLAADIFDACLNTNMSVAEYLGAIECAKWGLLERWLRVVAKDKEEASQ